MAGRLRLSVTRLARTLRHQDAGTLAPTLSAALATVDRAGPLTLGDLAQREHVAPPSITKAVDKLRGWASSSGAPTRPIAGARSCTSPRPATAT